MKNTEQAIINARCERAFKAAMDEYGTIGRCHCGAERLRSCSADVIITDNWYLLRSYKTIIAVIDVKTGICYDCLRMVYGYTATSAQHVSKFWHDYGGTYEKSYSECGRLTWC